MPLIKANMPLIKPNMPLMTSNIGWSFIQRHQTISILASVVSALFCSNLRPQLRADPDQSTINEIWKKLVRVANTLFNWRHVRTKHATNQSKHATNQTKHATNDIKHWLIIHSKTPDNQHIGFCGLSTILQQFETAVESRSRSKHNQRDMKKTCTSSEYLVQLKTCSNQTCH